MGIRESLNKSPKIGIAVFAGLCVLALVVNLFFFGGASGGDPAAQTARFTSDDGKTHFVDSASSAVPFQKDGKEVVGCEVSFGPGDQKGKVLYLYRYVPGVHAQVRAAFTDATKGDPRFVGANVTAALQEIESSGGKEVKAPGAPASEWVKSNSARGQAIIGDARK